MEGGYGASTWGKMEQYDTSYQIHHSGIDSSQYQIHRYRYTSLQGPDTVLSQAKNTDTDLV